MYIVLAGDLKSSRKIKDRVEIQKKLKKALKIINERFKEVIIGEFIIVGGDGFQGMITSPEFILNIYYLLFENIEHPFYLGIGIGDISTALSKNVAEMDGKVFYRASEALEKTKRENKWIELKSDWEDNDIVGCLLNFMAEVMWNWSKRQKDVVIYYRKARSKKSRVTLVEISTGLGIKKQTLSKMLKRAKYSLLEDAEKIITAFVSQKWLKRDSKDDL
ncbi:SatD [Candidatus Aerophobetes bacterium]|nr:SatD [Candidatus Aerophobetes bacterium]